MVTYHDWHVWTGQADVTPLHALYCADSGSTGITDILASFLQNGRMQRFVVHPYLSKWSKRTKYSVLFCVTFLTVQTEQSAVVEIFDEAFKLVTERTPCLQNKHTLIPNTDATSSTSLSLFVCTFSICPYKIKLEGGGKVVSIEDKCKYGHWKQMKHKVHVT